MWDLIVSVPDHCLSFYFTGKFIKTKKQIMMFNYNYHQFSTKIYVMGTH